MEEFCHRLASPHITENSETQVMIMTDDYDDKAASLD